MKRPWQKHMQRAVNNGHITPGEFLAAAVIDLAVLCGLGVLLWLCLGFASGAKGAELVPGSVIATRNRVESLNTSPGSLNHLSIYVGNGEVIESQGGVVENQGPGVIKTKLSDFLARGYETPLVLLPRDRAAGERAATKAASLVGTKFRKASSIFNRFGNRRTERGLNCVALVEVCYSDAGKRLRRITKPDDIFKLKELFEPARRLERPKPAEPAEPEPEPANERSLLVKPVKLSGATTANYSVAESRLFEAINDYREARKLCPLSLDSTLMRVARLRVNIFNHNHPRFGWVKEHARREGFPGFATDNIAQGYESPEAAVGNARTGWGDERPGHTVGHDMQMKGFAKVNGRWVNYQFNRVGVAVRGRTYIAVFGRSGQQRVAELSK